MELEDFRLQASLLSKGTSSSIIKDKILYHLQRENLSGNLLDFGAGLGELLSRIASNETLRTRFDKLCGSDLLPRPADLPESIKWFQQDLNDSYEGTVGFDVIICSETIEHLENPREVFRTLYSLMKPGGTLILTMPNQECIRSYCTLLMAGHFAQFTGDCYPAHITALLRMDLARMCEEVGLSRPAFYYTDEGGIPKMARVKWQKVSFGLLRGRLYSDNVIMIARRPEK